MRLRLSRVTPVRCSHAPRDPGSSRLYSCRRRTVIAEALNLSRAEVHGVISFYHYFRTAPGGRHVIHVCRAEACRSMHCEDSTEHAKARLGVDFHQTTADGAYTAGAGVLPGQLCLRRRP